VPLTGSSDQLLSVYPGIPSERLVILGRAGAGKTVLAIRLLLGLLTKHSPGQRVPVILNIGSWDPDDTDLGEWLTARLARDHPRLNVSVNAIRLAESLLARRRILPILDGFDELRPELREAALRQLNAITLPLVLTSRPEEYADAVLRTAPLTEAVAIELDALDPEQAAAYLSETSPQLLSRMITDPTGVPAQALSTPWALFLARTTYSERRRADPVELLDAERFPTRESIEEHLLGEFLRSAYQEPTSTWPIERARGWLVYLAEHLRKQRTPDLIWWELRDTVPRDIRTFVCGVGFALALEAALGVAGQFESGLVFGLLFGAMSGLLQGPVQRETPVRPYWRVFGQRLRATLPAVVAFGLLGGYGFGLLAGPVVGLRTGLSLVLGLLCLTSVLLLIRGYKMPPDALIATTFLGTLASVRNRTLSIWFTIMIPYGLVFGFTGGGTGTDELLTMSLRFGLTFGVAFTFASPLGQWLLFARLWLPSTGQLPWRIHAFLTDAYQRGVLRQTGAAYQFRHLLLQDYLAGGTAKAPVPTPIREFEGAPSSSTA